MPPDKQVPRPCGIEITEILIIINTYVRAERMLGTIKVEVTVGAVGILCNVTDEVTAEAVAHPYAEFIAP